MDIKDMNTKQLLEAKNIYDAKIKNTEEELDYMWQYCLQAGHSLINQLDKCGKDWRDLNLTCIATLEKEYLKLKDKELSINVEEKS